MKEGILALPVGRGRDEAEVGLRQDCGAEYLAPPPNSLLGQLENVLPNHLEHSVDDGLLPAISHGLAHLSDLSTSPSGPVLRSREPQVRTHLFGPASRGIENRLFIDALDFTVAQNDSAANEDGVDIAIIGGEYEI